MPRPFDQPPVVRLDVPLEARDEIAPQEWPWALPAIAQLLADGLDLGPGVTFLVGENGSGKSTLLEAAAQAYGLSPEGGTINAMHSTRPTESPLGGVLRAQRGVGTRRWGFFLRAESMHGWYTFTESIGGPTPPYHEMSHGESFSEVIGRHLDGPGFYCLDEPEAALSFSALLSLMQVLQDVTANGGQVLCATHSPVLAALPGARIVEVGEWGLRASAWEDLDLVRAHRWFLEDPQRYLRHLD